MATTNDVLNKLSVTPKEVSYLNKSFVDFKGDLITFIKNYYPTTWTDFNEANPGMIMLELAAYVGDVLSFYVDNSFKENLLAYAEEEGNIITIAQAMGYKPKTIVPATTEVLISQVVPALGVDDGYIPDANYFLKIGKNSTMSTLPPNVVTFRTMELVDFADPTDRIISPRQLDPITLLPITYLVTKKVKVIAGDIRQETFTFGDPEKFSTITMGDVNVTTISDVVDADGYKWYEVDYLAQDTIVDDREVSYISAVSESVSPSYAMKFRTVPRRFVTRLTPDKRTQLVFGSGRGNVSEDVVYLDSQQVANSEYGTQLASVSLSNTDLLNTDNFGLAPANTTITVTYFTGGGVDSNVASGTILQTGQLNILNRTTEFNQAELDLFNDILSTVTVFNEMPARGGQDGESVEEIRQRALASYSAQNRIVTRRDYEARTLAMPAKYGAVAKVFAISDTLQSKIQAETTPEQVDETIRQYVEDTPKPNAINLYVLGYNQNKKITTLNGLVKSNLQQYLSQYRMLTDQVNILDAFVVNIGVNFDITVFKNYNMSDVIAVCLGEIKNYFDIDKWNINQPIRLGDLSLLLNAQDGVQSVNRIEIVNKYFFKDGRDYQPYRYDIAEAIVDGVVYPSLDPCIFEIRYPEDDIVGSARQ
jgi:hypothetical protein